MMYVAFIVLSCGLLVSGQTTTESIPLLPDGVPSTTQSNAVISSPPQPPPCLSVNKWTKLEGLCISRSHCDYGTPAIDFTLYVAKGYKRPCAADKVCCPIHYIITDTPPKDDHQPIQHKQNGDFSDESELNDY